MIEEENDIANEFSKYFIESVREIVDSIERKNVDLNEDNYTNEKFDSFQMVTNEIRKQIITDLAHKSGTKEGISSDIKKIVANTINDDLIDVYNDSLSQGHVPIECKHSQITPIQKIKGTNKAEEFRPINLLQQHEKVLEKIVAQQLTEYFEKNNLFTDEQYGFRAGRSCEQAVQKTVSEWKKKIEEDCIVSTVFIDLKKGVRNSRQNYIIEKT
uniref:Reverse transcriptase domain-containing protein n=1 Tax=Bracon brevicornis TaxID=1563983 RepID=A0A6V7JMU5_9HYME